jgi:class 3 adenylate cyclase
MERRLTAILAADVVGYSRLMTVDEAGTLATLKSLRKNLVDPKIREHNGRIFKVTGDGIFKRGKRRSMRGRHSISHAYAQCHGAGYAH